MPSERYALEVPCSVRDHPNKKIYSDDTGRNGVRAHRLSDSPCCHSSAFLGVSVLLVVSAVLSASSALSNCSAAQCLPTSRVVPESARWLVTKERYEEADVILNKAARFNRTYVPEKW